MSRFDDRNLAIAREIISRYPRPKSALIPLLHLAQEQDGWVTDDAMRHIAELTGTTPAEVKGTGTFYEMFKFHPVGTYVVNVCTNLSCQLLGGEELLAHAEATLGVKAGGTTADGMFTSKMSSASQPARRPLPPGQLSLPPPGDRRRIRR
ncbi:MAG: NAD(P)H-dependent oxidoreductase subunit E [Acidimicrobiales bacterium]